jgi:hypothetical protein
VFSFPKLALAAAAAVLLAAPLSQTASAAPLPGAELAPKADSQVTKAQFGLYFGFGEPSYYSSPYYGRPYYPSYGYGPSYGYSPYYGYRSSYSYRPAAPTYYYGAPGAGFGSDAVAACASRFRSFDPRTGTYVTYEGEVVLCPYLR